MSDGEAPESSIHNNREALRRGLKRGKKLKKIGGSPKFSQLGNQTQSAYNCILIFILYREQKMQNWQDDFQIFAIGHTQRALSFPLNLITMVTATNDFYGLYSTLGTYCGNNRADGFGKYQAIKSAFQNAGLEILEQDHMPEEPTKTCFVLNRLDGMIGYPDYIHIFPHGAGENRISLGKQTETKEEIINRFLSTQRPGDPIVRTAVPQGHPNNTVDIVVKPHTLKQIDADRSLGLTFTEGYLQINAYPDNTLWHAQDETGKALRTSFGPDEKAGFWKWHVAQRIAFIDKAITDIMAVHPSLPVIRHSARGSQAVP